MKHASLALALALLSLPVAAFAGPPGADRTDPSVNEDIRQGMAEARAEIAAELAKARLDLDAGNLDIGNGLHFGRHHDDKAAASPNDKPRAEITPKGDFLIDDKAVAIDAGQRAQLLAYRTLVIGIAKEGIDIGERSALAAVDQVDRGLFGLMLGALTGSTERKVERQVETAIKPAVEQLCRRPPAVLASQRQLAASLPAFAPYAELGQDDIGDCERSVREAFAMR